MVATGCAGSAVDMMEACRKSVIRIAGHFTYIYTCNLSFGLDQSISHVPKIKF